MNDIKLLSIKRQILELSSQHNKLTVLCKLLYSSLKKLNKEVGELKKGTKVSTRVPVNVQPQQKTQKNESSINDILNGNLNDLHADEILKQLAQST